MRRDDAGLQVGKDGVIVGSKTSPGSPGFRRNDDVIDSQKLDQLGIERLRSGKVRDLYRWQDELWLVASDRLSAFDVILPTAVPDKGVLLTQLARYWFDLTSAMCRNAVLSYEPPQTMDLPEWEGRLVRQRPLKVVPMECVVRGYLSGSGWKQYQEGGAVCGISLATGLVESEALREPIFTPTTKADAGHDEPLTPSQAQGLIGVELYEKLRDTSIDLYDFAHRYAKERGIILADTKFEFGLDDAGEIVLCDEIFTPDSSRFWPAEAYEPGRGQASFDKQFVRDYLEGLDWDKQPPGPDLPPSIVDKTLAKYQEALDRVTTVAL